MKPTDTSALSARDLLPEHGWLSRFCFDLILRHLPDLAYGTLDLELPNGQTLQFGQAHEGEPRAELRLHSMKAIRRLISDGLLGWAEGYMAGEWDSLIWFH